MYVQSQCSTMPVTPERINAKRFRHEDTSVIKNNANNLQVLCYLWTC